MQTKKVLPLIRQVFLLQGFRSEKYTFPNTYGLSEGTLSTCAKGGSFVKFYHIVILPFIRTSKTQLTPAGDFLRYYDTKCSRCSDKRFLRAWKDDFMW
jgi:hypothetical protein